MKLKLKAWIKSDKLILNVSGLIVLAAFNVLSGAPTSKQMQVKSMGPLDFFFVWPTSTFCQKNSM